MFQEEKLLSDFIQQTECDFTTLDGLNISMFRLVLERALFKVWLIFW